MPTIQQVATNLVLTATNASHEWSRAVEIGEHNRVVMRYWVLSGSAPSSTRVDFNLEGSNDLTHWSSLGTATVASTTDFPLGAEQQYTGNNTNLPWRYVRVHYRVRPGTPATTQSATLATSIESERVT